MLHSKVIAAGRIAGEQWKLKDRKLAAQASQMCFEVFLVPSDTQGIGRNSNCQLLECQQQQQQTMELQLQVMLLFFLM